MNIEKVLDIAVQADPTTVEVLGEVGGRAFIAANGIRPQFIQKFAELIVRECTENFTKVWYEQGLDIRGAELDKFLKRFQEYIGVDQ